jgi:predicted short-subunit dehydrogenase-like oxidoreductase (DUF2520 family)
MLTSIFIGAGNLAWHLAPAFENAGYPVEAVYSRQLNHARQLTARLYDARPVSSLNFADSAARLFVLAVPDDAFETVCRQLVLPEQATLVHTSGSQPLARITQLMTLYSDVPVKTGVLYALQTFSRGQSPLDYAEIPLCLEADDDETETQLVTLGQELSNTVYVVNSAERKVLHLAAVLACNFTNHLLGLAKDLTDAEGLEFSLLQPLILETVRKALAANHPAEVQTGPARRNDTGTLDAHRKLLALNPLLLAVYNVLTDSIQRRN